MRKKSDIKPKEKCVGKKETKKRDKRPVQTRLTTELMW